MKKLCLALFLAATCLYLPRLEAAKPTPCATEGRRFCAECTTNADCAPICGQGCEDSACFFDGRTCLVTVYACACN